MSSSTVLDRERLRRLMAQAGLRAADVADALDTDPGNVSKWLSGQADPNGYSTARLCQLLGVTAEHLFGLEPGNAERDQIVGMLDLLRPRQREELLRYARYLLSEAPPSVERTDHGDDDRPQSTRRPSQPQRPPQGEPEIVDIRSHRHRRTKK